MIKYREFFLLAYGYFLVNYFVSNGFFYWLCWKSKREAWAAHRIKKDREPRPGQVASEIRSSVKSLAWCAAIATFVFYCFRHGHSALFIGRVARGYHLAS
jgi:hypothetical protein